MRIAFVLTNLSGGGAEKATLKTISLLSNAGHQCRLFLLESRFAYSPPSELSLCLLSDKQETGKNWFSKRLLGFKLREEINSFDPAIVISTLPFADEVTALSGVKNHWCRIANTLSVEIEGLAGSGWMKAKRRMRRYQRIYGSRNLIAVSQGVANDLKQMLKIHSRIQVIPNPFNRGLIAKKSVQQPLVEIGKPFILYVGRFAPQKRIDLLLDAFSQMPDRLDLIMITPPSDALKKMIDSRRLTSRVFVLGFQENPYAYMSRAELLVLTSDQEGLPNVLIESLICGTPVVSTDCPSGPREILSEISPDSLVPCGDLDALIRTMTHFLSRCNKPMSFDTSRYDEANALASYEHIFHRLES